APTPTVMIAASPSPITTGKRATITWSSTNATGCTASGAWNGAEAVSGSLSVTPASKGSLTYALACTGSSGMANGSATLTVTAPPNSGSGGGALGVWSLLGLAFLGLTGRVSRRI